MADQQRAELPARVGMQRWIVTGPTGAGKSLFVRELAARGAATISGDAIGHDLLGAPNVVAAIAREFGPAVCPGGRVDRAALGRVVFGAAAALRRLDAIMLPLLAQRFQQRFDDLAAEGRWRLAVLEAAVYFLLPSPGPVDLVIAVVADIAVREQRLVTTGGITPLAARQRIEAQRDWDRFWSRADVVIENEGSTDELAAAAEALLVTHLGGTR